jgi:electron transfer flavoprotein alpha/beta subunit
MWGIQLERFVFLCMDFRLLHYAVVRLPEPRYASLPNIMKAKKKPIDKISAADLGINLEPRLESLRVMEPLKRLGGSKVRSTLKMS